MNISRGRQPRILSVLIMLALAALACNLPAGIGGAKPTPTRTPGAAAMLTQVAQTVDAQLNLTPAAATGGAPTLTPTSTFIPPDTRAAPTKTPAPVTDTPQPCDEASFIQDVTIPDGTKVAPGQTFTKTWRLKNIGTCTWTASYAVVFTTGEAMGAPAVNNLTGSVPPNGLVDFSIEMKAPASAGKYTGFWKLRNASGAQFGVSGGDQPFYVLIEVSASLTPTVTVTPTVTPTPTPTIPGAIIYNFASNLCAAEWRSQAGVLACPGTQGDNRGYAITLTNPQMEDGITETNPVILTVPDNNPNGAITAKFPAVAIQQGMRFRVGLGCLYGASQCAVVYQVNYIVGSAQPANLGQWRHSYNGSVQSVDIDLSSLAGQNVQIILAVLADVSPAGDQPAWVFPRIVKP